MNDTVKAQQRGSSPSKLRQWTAKVWHSPTFTSWGNQLTQSLRLVLVTPLLLTHFNQTEIAAWYLFATLNIFGTIVAQRLGLTFSRMISFAMGGATDLSPIARASQARGTGQPNWEAVTRALRTLGFIQTSIAWLNVSVATGLGLFSLSSLLQDYAAPQQIWKAFALMQVTSLITFIYNRYSVTLLGMNQVAVTNRWNIVFSLISVICGAVALRLGANLFELVLVMQFPPLLNILRNRLLLKYFTRGNVASVDQIGWDREVVRWAWSPTWRGLISQMSTVGVVQLTGVTVARYGDPALAASYGLALRLLTVVEQTSQAPYSSIMPRLSRLMSERKLEELRRLSFKRMRLSLTLFVAGMLAIVAIVPWGLRFIEAKAEFPSAAVWVAMGGAALLNRFYVLCFSTCAIGNNIILYLESAAAAVMSLILVPLGLHHLGLIGVPLGLGLPLLLVLRTTPIKMASRQLEVPAGEMVKLIALLPFACYAVLLVGGVVVFNRLKGQ